MREKAIVLWSDRRLDDGERFDSVIRAEIERADAAILLVNARFLASDYIYRNELPTLLERHRRGKVTLHVLVLEPCAIDSTRFKYPDAATGAHELCLGELQASHQPAVPLDAMTIGHQRKVRKAPVSFEKRPPIQHQR